MLKRLGVELKVVGTPARAGPMLLVSNHISWLDIVALHAVCHCRFVSKADVERWPLIGTAGDGRRHPVREARVAARRHARGAPHGAGLAGWGHPGRVPGRNHRRRQLSAAISFQSDSGRDLGRRAGAAGGAPDSSTADPGRPSRAASYMGDESLAGSIWRTLCARELCAVVVFGAPQRAGGRDRRAWAQELRREIAAMRQPEGQHPSSPRRSAMGRPLKPPFTRPRAA